MVSSKDNSLGTGVYYHSADYAGFFRRLFAIAIDLGVLYVLSAIISRTLNEWAWDRVVGEYRWDPVLPYLVTMAVIIWTYLAWIKRSKLRTIGYRITGLEIVSTRGVRPALWRMTIRLMLWIFGPFNLALDLMWVGADGEHQSLRDCYAGTYVIRAGAKPAGEAEIHLAYYNAFGFALMYPRVTHSSQ